MSITVDKASLFTPVGNAGSVTSQAATTNQAVASGAMILLAVCSYSSIATARTHSVAGGSLTWTEMATAARGSMRVSLFRAFAPSGLASGATITATYSAAATTRALAALSLLGVDTSSPVVGSAGTSTAGAVAAAWTAGSVTPTAIDQWVTGLVMADSSTATTSTPAASWTEDFDWNSTAAGNSFSLIHRFPPDTNALNPSGTWANSSQTSVGTSVILRPVASDTTPPTTTATGTATRLSSVTGKDSTDVTITTDEAFVEYDIRVVSSSAATHTQGTSVSTATVASRTTHTVTLTESAIIAASGGAGTFILKAFTKDAAGNWSSA